MNYLKYELGLDAQTDFFFAKSLRFLKGCTDAEHEVHCFLSRFFLFAHFRNCPFCPDNNTQTLTLLYHSVAE